MSYPCSELHFVRICLEILFRRLIRVSSRRRSSRSVFSFRCDANEAHSSGLCKDDSRIASNDRAVKLRASRELTTAFAWYNMSKRRLSNLPFRWETNDGDISTSRDISPCFQNKSLRD